MPSAIQLDGSMAIVSRTIDNSFEEIDLTYEIHTVNRRAVSDISLDGAAPSYYVALTGNLNAFVDVSLSGDDNIDDAWSLAAFETYSGGSKSAVAMSSSVSDISLGNDDGQENFSLSFTTEASTDTTIVGHVDIVKGSTLNDYGVTNSETNTFLLKVTSQLGATGLLTFSHAYDTDATKTLTVTAEGESTQLAQEIYFADVWAGVGTTTDVEASSLGLTDVSNDQFSVTVSVNTDLSDAIHSELSAVEGETIVTSLQFNVDAIDASNTNSLTQWANSNNYDGSGNGNLFESGQEVWVNHGTGAGVSQREVPISLTINNYEGNATEVISTTLGIKLVQSASGAR